MTIKGLLNDVRWNVVVERIIFVAAIRNGLEELDSGKSIPVEEIENELNAWIDE